VWRRGSGGGGGSRKEFPQVCILDGWPAVLRKPERNLQHDVFVAMRGVQDAGAVGEAAVGVAPVAYFAGRNLEHAYGGDGLGHLLAIGADVLHRRSADSSGNSAETFKTSAIPGDGHGHEVVPILPRASGEFRAGTLNSKESDLQHHAWPASIGNHKVTAAPQHEQRQTPIGCVADGVFDFNLGMRFDKIPRGSAYLKRGQRRERDVFLDLQRSLQSIAERTGSQPL